MNNEVERDMSTSIKLFDNILWPTIKTNKKFINASIVSIEGVRSELAEHLDMIAGLDAIIKTNKGLIGLAIRIQANDNTKNWRTFTIRASRSGNEETEYNKRLRSVNSDIYMHPPLTCQAYFDGLKLLGYGIAKTKDIILSINKYTEIKQNGNAMFYVIPYKNVRLIEMECN